MDQWAAFVDTVINDGPDPASGADGRAPLVIATAALKSLHDNRPVTTEEVDTPRQKRGQT